MRTRVALKWKLGQNQGTQDESFIECSIESGIRTSHSNWNGCLRDCEIESGTETVLESAICSLNWDSY